MLLSIKNASLAAQFRPLASPKVVFGENESRRADSAIFHTPFCALQWFITRGGVEEDAIFKTEAKDQLFEDRHFRGQGQECLRPSTKTTWRKCSPKKKRSPQIFRDVSANFQGKVKKSWPWVIFNESKKVLSYSRGLNIFEDL